MTTELSETTTFTLKLIRQGKLKYPVEITILTAALSRVTLAVERHRFHFRV